MEVSKPGSSRLSLEVRQKISKGPSLHVPLRIEVIDGNLFEEYMAGIV
jgi:hypothetical protein